MPKAPQEIDKILVQLAPADQDKYLESLPPEDLHAYANWSQESHPNKGEGGISDVNGYSVHHAPPVNQPMPEVPREVPDEELHGLTGEQLKALSEGVPYEEVQKQKGGFLDTGMGLAGRGLLKGLAAPAVLMIGEDPNKVADALGDNLGMRRPGDPGDQTVEDVFSVMSSLGGIKAVGKGLEVAGEHLPGWVGKGVGGTGRLLNWDRKMKVLPFARSSAIGGGYGSEAAVASGAGVVAGDTVRNRGGDTKDQIIAEMVAAGLPGGIKSLKDAGTRRLFGANTSEAKANIANALNDFGDLGTTPSVGQATQAPRARGIEAFLSKLFGTSGIIQHFGQNQESAIGRKAMSDATSMSAGSDPADVGKIVQESIDKNWRPRQTQRLAKAWSNFDAEHNPDWMVNAGGIKQFLADNLHLNPKDPGGIGGIAQGDRSTVQQIQEAFDKTMGANATFKNKKVPKTALNPASGKVEVVPGETVSERVAQDGGVPFEALKQFRTNISQQLEQALVDGSPQAGLWRKLYGLTTESMKDGLKRMDSAQARKAAKLWEQASRATRDYHDTLDIIGKTVSKEGGWENIYKDITGGTTPVSGQLQIGGTKLYNIIKNLQPPERRIFAGTFISRMGGPGNEWNLKTFITNFDKLDENTAKAALFRVLPPGIQDDYKKIVSAGKNIMEGREKYGVSVTPKEAGGGRNFFLFPFIGVGGGLVHFLGSAGDTNLLTSGLTAAGGAVVAGGIGRAMAHKMVDPKFVRWLAQSTELPKSAIPAALANLEETARQEHDPELQTIVDFYKNKATEEFK